MSEQLIKTKYLFDKEYIGTSCDINNETKRIILDILKHIDDNIILKKILNDDKNLKNEYIAYTEIENALNHQQTVASVILTYNEERCIKRCINSVLKFSNEVIIIDSQSTDNTVNRINEINNDKIKIYEIKWINDFTFARNFGLERVHSDWVFFIDADEYMEPNYDGSIIPKLLTFLSLTLDTSRLIICPSIYDESSDNIVNTVTRIFSNNKYIYYYGKVHEELRCKNPNVSSIIINLNIKMRHDGYLPEVLENKDKLNRNLKILTEMINDEPNNPRWLYFYCRESYYLYSQSEKITTIEKILLNNILIDLNKGIEMDNVSIHNYTFQMLDLLCKIKIAQKNYDDVQNITAIMNVLKPSNSDVVYYSHFAEIMKIKQKNAELLSSIINYRKNHFEMQENVISSSGYHIDFLIAILLFENMEYKKAYAYFNFLKDKLYDKSFKSLINYYLEILKNM